MLLLVLDAVDQCNNVMVKLQLSVDGHSDFCFITRNERSQLSLIKVKKVYMIQICALRRRLRPKCSRKLTLSVESFP